MTSATSPRPGDTHKPGKLQTTKEIALWVDWQARKSAIRELELKRRRCCAPRGSGAAAGGSLPLSSCSLGRRLLVRATADEPGGSLGGMPFNWRIGPYGTGLNRFLKVLIAFVSLCLLESFGTCLIHLPVGLPELVDPAFSVLPSSAGAAH